MKSLIEVALSQYGEKEIKGSTHNKDIVNYSKELGFDYVDDDETPWCSIFANWVAMKAGFEKTDKLNARSWLEVGERIETPDIGDVVVFWRESPDSWKGHVAFFVNFDNNIVRVLGGNQSDMVNISAYNRNQILGFRRLKKSE